MIAVDEALAALFELTTPLEAEEIALRDAGGRVLRAPMVAERDQPPFDASAMDGYAVATVAPNTGDRFEIIGVSAAGHGLDHSLAQGECARIFTGAPCPPNTQKIIIQEDVIRDGNHITLKNDLDMAEYIRPRGRDFRAGFTLNEQRRLSARDILVLGAMNKTRIPVGRRPHVAILATGDELCLPGGTPAWDQIFASNGFGIAARLEQFGATTQLLPIAKDTHENIDFTLSMARDADIILTIGGASVGEHDLISSSFERHNIKQSFYKIAMRPGKPLMAGKWEDRIVIGLPGNPVSAMVCCEVFVIPVLNALQGLPKAARPRQTAKLKRPLAPNGKRLHFMRGYFDGSNLDIFENQDSSMMRLLSDANCLAIQNPQAQAQAAGSEIDYITL